MAGADVLSDMLQDYEAAQVTQRWHASSALLSDAVVNARMAADKTKVDEICKNLNAFNAMNKK